MGADTILPVFLQFMEEDMDEESRNKPLRDVTEMCMFIKKGNTILTPHPLTHTHKHVQHMRTKNKLQIVFRVLEVLM